ncbi:protein brambleberry-like [Ornithodoros turicata]|uniref:protein brambleberry-like n=1 Tax=Ornithodoros turicata TaxID=34597 RepID=UPI0031397EF0
MCFRTFLLMFIVLAGTAVQSECFFDWFLGRSSVVTDDSEPHDFNKDGTKVLVPFEMKSADDEFLQEGKKYGLKLSSLDVCHHRIFLSLKGSCSSMTEEEMGKLSVRLLNCQSAVEGRPTFPCTDEMTLRDCTRNMDQHTWNSYHLVSNRARAVCFSTRQQQFYAKTEMTVNKLVWSSEQQVRAMSELERSQQKVSSLTSETLDAVASGHVKLLLEQERLTQSQGKIQTFVEDNLEQLTKEKALIAAGQKELAAMTEDVRKRLDNASSTMLQNEQQRQSSHRDLLRDLSVVQEKAKLVYEKIDNSTKKILGRHHVAAEHLKETLESLSQINASIAYLFTVVEKTRLEVDGKLSWVANLLQGTDNQLSTVCICVSHVLYLLSAMSLAAFLRVPMTSRVVMLLVVPMNAVAEIRQSCCLNFASLSLLLIMFLSVEGVTRVIGKVRSHRFVPALDDKACSDASTHPVHARYKEATATHTNIHSGDSPAELLVPATRRSSHRRNSSSASSTLEDLVDGHREGKENDGNALNSSSVLDEVCNSLAPSTSTPMSPPSPQCFAPARASMIRRDLLSYLDVPSRNRRVSPARSTGSNLSRLSNRRICSGLNKSGAPCKGTCLKGQDYCYHHAENGDDETSLLRA